MNQTFIKKEITKVEAKLFAIQAKIEKRRQKSAKDFPGKNILELETIEDWIYMASLEGELKALRRLAKKNGGN